ncbi:DUF7352 domain-containing protein [Agrobacterium tumefaciens]|uniref:DUF7352 domain-containing protein n=1 Tax=Agrobacterium tumefaciens TaxID=358 RepID=UPI0015734399|nr:hypothetical protein [Agrobacterium tumefaciens]WCJ63956.1 hypothetical protein G6M15_07145 [Agrobacterium tumefaciens]
MKARCLDNVGTAGSLIEGKVYTVHQSTPNPEMFIVDADEHGRIDEYFKKRFEVIPEIGVQADQWDASTRGPKMANPKGKAIFKYQMPVLEQFEMKLPQGALIIRMEDQGGMFWLWAVVDTRAPDETRKFRAFKTGAPIPDSFDGKYIGFCKIQVQQELGLYIFEDVAR